MKKENPWRIVLRQLAFLLVALAGLSAVLANCGRQQSNGGRAAATATGMALPEETPSTPTVNPTAAAADLSGVRVTGSAEGAPDGCTVDTVAGRLLALAEAVNEANPGVVPQFFGTSDATFQWYCMQSFSTYSLDELDAYFRQRYGQNERWRLQSVQVNGWDQGRGVLHFGPVVISRMAGDLDSASEALGKGAYSCRRREFVVLCLGEGTGAGAGEVDATFAASGLIFPTEGCWEVEAEAGNSRLRFVVQVEPPQRVPQGGSCQTLAEAVQASDGIIVGRVVESAPGPEGRYVWHEIGVNGIWKNPYGRGSFTGIKLLQDTHLEPPLAQGRSYLLFLQRDPFQLFCPERTLAEIVDGALLEVGDGTAGPWLWEEETAVALGERIRALVASPDGG